MKITQQRNNTNVYLKITVSCQSWWHEVFETDRRNVKRKTECSFEMLSHVCKEQSKLQKSSSMKSIRVAIDRFLRSSPFNNHFPLSPTPLLLMQIEFVKDLRKTGMEDKSISPFALSSINIFVDLEVHSGLGKFRRIQEFENMISSFFHKSKWSIIKDRGAGDKNKRKKLQKVLIQDGF